MEGNGYIGRTVAGGIGSGVDLDGDGKPDVTFSSNCRFLMQLKDGRVVAIEADRRVRARVQGRAVDLWAYMPVEMRAAQR